eukprot:gene8186-13566_t
MERSPLRGGGASGVRAAGPPTRAEVEERLREWRAAPPAHAPAAGGGGGGGEGGGGKEMGEKKWAY